MTDEADPIEAALSARDTAASQVPTIVDPIDTALEGRDVPPPVQKPTWLGKKQSTGPAWMRKSGQSGLSVAKDIVQAAASGINAGAADLVGTAADAATNVFNLGQAAAGVLTGRDYPVVDPDKVPLTSGWFKNQARKIDPGIVDANSRNPAARIIHAGAEIMGPLPAAVKLGEISEATPQTWDAIVGSSHPEGSTEELQDTLNASARESDQSVGARSSAPDISKASPQLQDAIRAATKKTGGAVNQDALMRHLDADQNGVQLSEGQALRDPTLFSEEQNERAVNGGVDFFNKQNDALVKRIEVLRDEFGPDVNTTNAEEHANTLIDAYQAKDAATKADINKKYQALRDAAGGEFPIDTGQLLTNIRSALKKGLKTGYAPSNEMNELQRFAEEGSMSFEDFETMRTNLAETMRSTSDGNVRAAARIMREQIEQLPLQGNAADLKGLADQARASAKARFDQMDADPAYKAAVRYDSEAPGKDRLPAVFINRYVRGASNDQLSLMRSNIGNDDKVRQTIATSALDTLKAAAVRSGKFTHAGYNNALQRMDPIRSQLFTAEQNEKLDSLGRTASDALNEPAGGFTNRSNTHVSQMAEAAKEHTKELGKTMVEGYVNAHTGGILGTVGRKIGSTIMKGKALEARTNQAFSVGAGLTRLPETK